MVSMLVEQLKILSIFEGNLKIAQLMRKPANRLGNDFLQSVLGIGVGFERGG
jgi:hypothetical protein